MNETKAYVTYEDFGALGDGRTNDFEAIMNAHAYANEHHLPVLGNPDKTYYISDTEKDGVARRIVICTDVDWQGAHFILDDTTLTHEEGSKRNYNSSIFVVEPYEKKTALDEEVVKKVGSLKKTDAKIDLGLGYPALLIVYNDNHKVYIRYGANANNGSPQHEVVLIDKDGNIDPSTPIMHDYESVTRIEVIKVDIPTLVIQNGIFTQRATHVSTTKIMPDGTKVKNAKYFHRNLLVQRSNTIVRNLENYIEGEITLEEQAEGMTGPAYKGFYTASNANNVLIENCVVSARRYYTPGTYGFGASNINGIVLKNCKQANFYLKDENGNLTTINSMERSSLTGKPVCWGLGGTNFCKNMVYDGCEITRFDAHQGLCNGKIINSKCSYINLIGYGDMIIENSYLELKDPTFFQLRRDYGSTWEGTVTIRNCEVAPNETVSKKDTLYLCSTKWYNHDFGYVCHFPNILIDNVRLIKRDVPVHVVTYDADNIGGQSVTTEPLQHKSVISDGVTENKNPYVPPKFIKVINNAGGHKYYVKKTAFFEDTLIEGVEVVEN